MSGTDLRIRRGQFLKAGMVLIASSLLLCQSLGCQPPASCEGVIPSPLFPIQRCYPALGDLMGGKRPNILLVITDQEQDPRFLPPSLNRPNLDRLRSTAVRFTNTFCTYPLCSPSRSSIFSGTYPHQNGVFGNVVYGARGRPLDPLAPHLGSVLRSAGYRIGYRGKWDLSMGPGYYDGDYSDRGCASDYGFEGHFGPDRPDQELGQTADFEVVAQACDWIRQQQGRVQPWFLAVSIINPHDIQHLDLIPDVIRPDAHLPANLNDDLSTKPSDQLRYEDMYLLGRAMTDHGWLILISYYYSLLETIDQHLGSLYQVLEETDSLENTIVIYTSDHGELGGAHRFPFKGLGYEEDLRVPLYISHPGLVQGASEALVSNLDLAPTIAHLAGITAWPVPIPALDFSRLITDPTATHRDAVFAEFEEGQYVPGQIDQAIWTTRFVRTPEWKFTYSQDLDDGQLYNIADDPIEMINQYHNPAYAIIRDELRARLVEWQELTDDYLLP